MFSSVKNENPWLSKKGRENQAGEQKKGVQKGRLEGTVGGYSYICLLDHDDDFTCAQTHQIICFKCVAYYILFILNFVLRCVSYILD